MPIRFSICTVQVLKQSPTWNKWEIVANFCSLFRMSELYFWIPTKYDFNISSFFFFQTYREEVPGSWSTLYSAPIYSKAGDAFLLLAPLRDGDYGNYPHIALIETNRTHIVHPLTFGHFEVEKILAWDETNSLVWVLLIYFLNKFCNVFQGWRHLFYFWLHYEKLGE